VRFRTPLSFPDTPGGQAADCSSRNALFTAARRLGTVFA
jgi:hypothetical protein